MITIGMAIAGDDTAHKLAVEIHEALRWQVYSSKEFKHPAKLWEMQTLLLREIFDKMLSGRHQHEMAHTVSFHMNLLFTIVPRSIAHVDEERNNIGWIHAS